MLDNFSKSMEGVRIDLIDEANKRFHAVVLGPEGTSYEGGEWHFEFDLHEKYPFQFPIKNQKALTKLYHPDVENLEEGIPHCFLCTWCELRR